MRVGDKFRVSSNDCPQNLHAADDGSTESVNLPPGSSVVVIGIYDSEKHPGDEYAELLLETGETCVFYLCHSEEAFDYYFVKIPPLELLAECAE